ncbi:MAG TPA: efflux RND transporter periplasmic adaptor subunit, partial [Gemmataceae bacterium]|nr:efflux RND transporter periplasmic adaptor subunit [Gemmataceae bacterium]
NRLARVHVRFPGDIVEVGTIKDDSAASPSGRSERRPLRQGDRVKKGDLLCVVWSKDLGEKKSELVDNLSQLRLDRKNLSDLKKYADSIPPVRILEAERAVEQDLIAIARAERTLRAWKVPEEEIDALKAEADAIRQRGGKHDPEKEKSWPRVEIRAPLDGVVVERHANVGDVVVDNTLDLFKIANVDRLTVWAHAYEEDLPALQGLPRPVPWTVRVRADRDAPPMDGFIQTIGQVLDVNQHTALVMGEVDNSQGKLRAGQFVTATVLLPPPPDTVAIPATALVEDGRESVVFVQAGDGVYAQRKVAVVKRLADTVLVRSRVGAGEEGRGISPLKVGERVVSEGAVELKAALEDLQATAKEKR